MPVGIAFDDVPVEPSPEQVGLLLGAAPSTIRDIGERIQDRFKNRGTKPKHMKLQDSHPDFQYTMKMLEELNIEGEKRSQLTKRASNRAHRYYSAERLSPINTDHAESGHRTEPEEMLRARKHFPAKDVAFLLLLLVLVIVIWYVLGRY